jgi:hypothetical protein
MEKNNKIFFSIIFILLFLIPTSTAFNITTDEITENSITWNLSEIGVFTIVSASFDGINISDISPTTKILVSSDLPPRTGHVLTIIDSNVATSSKTAITLQSTLSENEKFYALVNLYFIFILAVICIIVGAFISPLGLAAAAISIVGLLTSVNNSFTMGLLFTVCLIVGIVEGILGWSD